MTTLNKMHRTCMTTILRCREEAVWQGERSNHLSFFFPILMVFGSFHSILLLHGVVLWAWESALVQWWVLLGREKDCPWRTTTTKPYPNKWGLPIWIILHDCVRVRINSSISLSFPYIFSHILYFFPGLSLPLLAYVSVP